ncbi:MAG TPA: hypothetical protein VK918_08755 [Pyrinomonadaceae bacterium]|nr:hypothetical protein [Pyrinomonadaceae bacterium]
MKNVLTVLAVLVALAPAAFSQKGVDNQTQKIRDDANKTTPRSTDSARTIDWGKGKTRTRESLANPYQLNGRRDVLINIVQTVLRENKIIVDEESSRPAEGIIVTQPFVFGRGPVIASAEIKRYGIIQYADEAWSQAQYSLIIEVQPIDGIRNNVSVNAKVEGRSGNGLFSQWTTVPSSGRAEDEFLAKLVEAVTGVSPDPVQDVVDPL